MIVYQFDINKSGLLVDLYNELKKVDISLIDTNTYHLNNKEIGFKKNIIEGDFSTDLDLPKEQKVIHLESLQSRLQKEYKGTLEIRAVYFYPKDGGMGWHTNSKKPGWRIYIPIPFGISGILTETNSYLDKDGFANAFLIDKDYTKSWHAVFAKDPRLSLGIYLPEDDVKIKQWITD